MIPNSKALLLLLLTMSLAAHATEPAIPSEGACQQARKDDAQLDQEEAQKRDELAYKTNLRDALARKPSELRSEIALARKIIGDADKKSSPARKEAEATHDGCVQAGDPALLKQCEAQYEQAIADIESKKAEAQRTVDVDQEALTLLGQGKAAARLSLLNGDDGEISNADQWLRSAYIQKRTPIRQLVKKCDELGMGLAADEHVKAPLPDSEPVDVITGVGLHSRSANQEFVP